VHNFGFALEGAWQVTGVTSPRPTPAGTVLGWVLFAIVLALVILGITFIVASGFGKALSFEHVFPTIVDK
jgi:hypothetical protein